MVNKVLVILAIFTSCSHNEGFAANIRATEQDETKVNATLGVSKVRPIRCPFFVSCEQLFDSSPNLFFPNGILRDTDLYDVKVSGSWELFFGYDNPTGTSMSFTETVKTGFEEVRSTTVYKEWTVSAGFSAQGAAVDAGYKSSVQNFASSTWSKEVETKRSVEVPAQSKVQIFQRTVSIEFIRKTNSFTLHPNANTAYFVEFPSPYTMTGSCVNNGRDYKLTPSMIGCGFNMNNIIFVFRTNCFSAEPDLAKRDAFCQVEKDPQ